MCVGFSIFKLLKYCRNNLNYKNYILKKTTHKSVISILELPIYLIPILFFFFSKHFFPSYLFHDELRVKLVGKVPFYLLKAIVYSVFISLPLIIFYGLYILICSYPKRKSVPPK